MFDDKQLARETQRTYARVLPRLEQRFAAHLADPVWQVYRQRLDAHFPQLFTRLLALYGDRYDFYYHLETVLDLTARSWLDRPDDLKTLDAARAADPAWYQREQMLGGVCYVDLFAGDLRRLRARIPYFQELGLTYLHLMPLFKAPEGDNDGGYAVSDYRQVDPDLGTMADLETLATELRAAGISLVLDFVFNHTSDEHRWPAARGGRSRARRLLLLFPDRTMPDAYDRTLREIFPDQHPGSFTYRPEIGQWVWTTFNRFQWDLNYRNPAVFHDMAAGDALPGQHRHGGVAAGCVGLHLEGTGHRLRESAPGAHAGAGLQRGVAHRRPALSSSPGHRPSRRGERVHQPGRMPAFVQPAAHGPAVEFAGDARGAAAAPLHGLPLCHPGGLRVGQLHPQPRRHRLDLRRRRRGRAGHQRLRPPALPQPVLHRALPRQFCPRPPLPGESAHGRRAHLGHAGVTGGAGARARTTTMPRSSCRCDASSCSTPSF
ncbi:MAG: alpha-amylase family glycosyl hydrolase [Caldilineaceae bacterium]